MLKWQKAAIVISVAGSEVTQDMLGFQVGKNRRIKFIAGALTASLTLRAYRTAEQCVNIPSTLLTSAAPLLPVDILLKEGDTFKLGYLDEGAGAATYNAAYAYEESD